MRIFVTGSAGFIGYHLARRLLEDGHAVDGYDGMTPYYDVTLKQARHAALARFPGFRPHLAMLEDMEALDRAMDAGRPDVVVHLAAQAGVRYSLENPRAYVDANLVGSFNLLEQLRRRTVAHFLFASTSSVYGGNPVMPFAEDARTDHPLTLYAATKKATEVMGHAYAHLWRIPMTGFRFFTVYGPWGRPDMALFKFVKAIASGEPVDIFNRGDMARDFTFVGDLVEAIVRLIPCAPPAGSPEGATDEPSLSPVAPFRVVNIGRGAPVRLLDFIDEIEKQMGRKAIRNYLPMQPGDVPATFANTDLLEKLTGYRPGTEVREGVAAFLAWFRDYYGTTGAPA